MIQNDKEYFMLVEALLPFGQKMLNQHGGLYPYAAVMTGEGEIAYVGSYPGDEQPLPTEVLDLLIQGIRQQAQETPPLAIGICVDVRVQDPRTGRKTDALQFIFEHASGEAFDVYWPYRKYFLRGYRFGHPFALPREDRVLPGHGS